MGAADLTLGISGSLPAFPGEPRPHFIPWSDLRRDGYGLELVLMSSHTGTHVDAPSHFVRGGAAVDRIPVDRLVVQAVLARIPRGPNEPITRADIEALGEGYGGLPERPSIVFHTGWQKNLRRGNYFDENPGLDRGAARYLASLGANLVGIDSPSIDCGRSRSFPAHNALLKGGTIIVENLANLGRIRQGSFNLAVLPLKLAGATGAPARAVAYW